MANIAPDNGGTLDAGGLQRLPFQDPNNFVVTPTKVLVQAQAQGQLGQLSDQLALEKAERQADMAGTQYKIAATGYLRDNLPLMNQATISDTLAKIATTRTAAQQAANELSTAQTYANTGAPATAGFIQAQQASNALAGAKADFGISGLDSITRGALGTNLNAVGSALGGYGQVMSVAGTGTNAPPAGAATPTGPFDIPTTLLGSTPGARPPAPPASTTPASATPVTSAVTGQIPSFTGGSGTGFNVTPVNPMMADMMQNVWLKNNTTEQTTAVLDQATGLTHQVINRVGVDGKVYSSTDLGVVKAENATALRTATKDLENLGTASTLASSAQDAKDAFDKAYPQQGGLWDYITSPAASGSRAGQLMSGAASGSTSVIAKGIGAMFESPEMVKLVSATQQLNQVMTRVDQESAKQLSGSLPSVADLTNPQVFQTKLDGAKSTIAARMDTYRKNNVLTKLNPGSDVAGEAPPSATTSSAPASPAVTHVITLKNGQRWNAALNQDGSYTPLTQVQ